MADARPLTTTEELLRRLIAVHAELVAKLERFRAEGKGETWTAQFVARQKAKVDAAIAQARRQIVGGRGKNGLAAEFAEQAYASGILFTNDVVEFQGGDASVTEEAFEAVHEDAAKIIIDELTGNLDANILRSRDEEKRGYDELRGAQAEAAAEALLTGETSSETVTRLLQKFDERGITGFTDKAGRKQSLANYADMLSRTIAARALQTAEEKRMKELGLDLVIVVGGEIPTTCATCRHYQGKILSLSGKDYPGLEGFAGSMETAKAASPPLGHPNCQHHWPPYIITAKPKPRADIYARARREAQRRGIWVDGWPHDMENVA